MIGKASQAPAPRGSIERSNSMQPDRPVDEMIARSILRKQAAIRNSLEQDKLRRRREELRHMRGTK